MDKLPFYIIAGLLGIMLFMQLTQEDKPSNDITYELHEREYDPTPEPIELVVNNPSAKETVIIERTIPGENVPDTLLREAYESLRIKYDSLAALRTYKQIVSDSIIDGEIEVQAKGYVQKIAIKYDLKPITLTDTTKTIVLREKGTGFYAIGGIDNGLDPSLGLGVTHERLFFSANYHLLNNGISLNLGYKFLNLKRKQR